MTQNALSGHGSLVYRAPAASPFTFTMIAEVGDISLPELMRNDFDATTQDINIDTYIVGVPRRNEVSLAMNFVPANGTQDHLTGLQRAFIDGTFDGYKFTTPGGLIWIASGFVKGVAPKAPVDGKLAADVKIRLSGQMWINGMLVG
jgi:hypothetical protein